MKGIVNSLLVVIYSYGGSELIAITVSEADNPKKRFLRQFVGNGTNHFILYHSIVLVINHFPWDTLANSSASPFVMVFEKMHIPFAADLVNFVIILALFSSINSGVYASSRLLYFRLKDKKVQQKNYLF